MHTLLYIKETNNKDLLQSTGNYIQCVVITYSGKESGKVYICMYIYITESLWPTLETNTTLWINYTSIKKKLWILTS